MAEIPNKSPGFYSLQVKPAISNPATASRQPSIINIPISNLPREGLSTGAVTINQSPVMTARLDQSRSSIFIPGISHRENLGSNIKILNIEDLPLISNSSSQPMGNIIIGSSQLLRSSEPKYQTMPAARQNISLDKLIQTSMPSQISSSITLHRTGVSNAPSQSQNVVIQVAAPERSQVVNSQNNERPQHQIILGPKGNQNPQGSGSLLSNISSSNEEIIQVPGLDVIPLSFDASQVFWGGDSEGSYLVHEPGGPEARDSSSSLAVYRLASSQQEHSGQTSKLHQLGSSTRLNTTIEDNIFPERIYSRQRVKEGLKLEMQKPLGPGPFTCQTCAKQFNKPSIYKSHLKEHLMERQYSCDKCNQSFNKIVNMQLHRMEHDVEIWSSLADNKEYSLECPACSINLTKLSRLAKINLHLANHRVPDDIACSRCEEEFGTEEELDKHVNDKHNNVNIASLPFSTLKATENVQRSFDCSKCIATFSSRTELRSHEDDHRKINSTLKPLRRRGGPPNKNSSTSNKNMKFSCKFCEQKFTCLSKMERHSRIHTGEKPFKCSICDKGFTQKPTLLTHELQHKGIKPHTCPLCKIGFTQRSHLKFHMKRVHDLTGKGFQCVFCSCSFQKVNYLHSHVTRFHSEEKKKVQDEYEALKKKQDEDIPPMNVDNPVPNNPEEDQEMLQIDIIQNYNKNIGKEKDILTRAIESAVNTTDLQLQQTVNPGEDKSTKKFVVLEERSFDGKIRKHVVRRWLASDGRAMYQCSWCPKNINKPSDLIRHIRIHTKDKPFRCPLCSRTFRLKSILSTHFRVHQKPLIECDSCSKKFVFVSDLKAHKIEKHSVIDFDEEEEYVPLIITPEGVRPVQNPKSRMFDPTGDELRTRSFACKVCKARFKRADHLKTHMLQHSDVKRFTCAVCEKKCRTKSNLNEHMKLHSNDQHNVCNICGKVYKWAQSLQYHLRTHIKRQNEYPYICPICKKSFKAKSSCVSHIKGHKSSRINADDVTASQDSLEGEEIRVSINYDNSTNKELQETQQTNQPIENFNENIANQFIIVQDTSNQQQNLDNDNLENEIHIHMPEEENVNQEVNTNESDLNVLATRGEDLLVTGDAIEAGNITENVHNQVLVDNEGTVLTTFDMVADSDGGLRLVESSKPLNFTNVDEPNIENAVVIVSLPMAVPSSSMTAMQSVTSNITLEPTINMTTSIASHLSEISSALPTEIMSTSTTSLSDTAQLSTVSYSQQIQMADNTFAVASKPSNNVFDESLDESRVDSVSDHDNESILPSSPLSTNQQEDIIDYDSDIKTVKIPLDSSSQQGSSKEEIEKMIHSALRLEEPESNTKFRCGVCSFESASIPYVLEHLKTHHEFITNKDEFILPIRFEEFPNTTIELVQDSHRENSQEKLTSFKCDACADVFSNNEELMSHQKCHVVKYYNIHKCEICKAEFRTKSGYVRHKNVHVKSNYHCGHIDCNMVFKNLNNLTKHNMTCHGGDPGEFIDLHTRRRLASQMKLSDEETRNLVGLPVKAGSSLSEQILIETLSEKHSTSPPKKQNEQVSAKGGKTNQCKICARSFKKNNDLVRHLRTHTGERPFHCKMCDKSFGFQSSLKNHMKTHTGGKSFSCHVCKSLFASKASLKIHMRIHTGTNPYNCQICQECFRTPAARKIHLARVHGYRRPPGGLITGPVNVSEMTGTSDDSMVPLIISAESLLSALQDIRQNNTQLQSGLIGATLQLELHSGQDFVCKDTSLPHHHLPTNKKDAGTEERKQSSEGNLTALVQLTVDEKILEQLNRKENINIVIKKKDFTQGKTIVLEDSMMIPSTSSKQISTNNQYQSISGLVGPLSSSHNQQILLPTSQESIKTVQTPSAYVVLQPTDNDILSESSRQIFEEPSNPTIDGGHAPTAALVNEGSENLPKIEILQLPILDEQKSIEDEYGVGSEIVNLNDDDAKDKLNKPLDYSTDSAHSNQVVSSIEDVYKYICPWCTIVFPSEQERIEHLWSAHGVEVREDVLEEDSANEKLAGTSNDNLDTLGDGDTMTIKKKKISRKINILRDTESGSKHTCHVCYKSFSKPSLLKRHESVHSGVKPFSCTICNKSFTQKTTLLVHQRIHEGSQPFTCEFCQQKFNQKSNLTNHIVRFHRHLIPALAGSQH